MRGIGRPIGALLAALIFLGGSEDAGAATLKANYQLQGDRGSEVAGAPELTDLGAGNRFAFEEVDGIARQVLTFPKGNGLSLSTAGLVDPSNHSVVMLFRLADVFRYRRILDFTEGASDNGLYDLNGKVVLYLDGNIAGSRGAVFDDGSYVQLALTNAAAAGESQETTVYVNGTAVAAARTSPDFDLRSGVLRFFKDNTSGAGIGEESAGALACVLVYDGVLTAGEVRQVAGDPTLCPAPSSTPGRARALATGRPQARESGRSIAVDTGLTVSCPVGTASCTASGRVDLAPTRGRATAATIEHLGAVSFSLPPGASRDVVVRLSGPGARALRTAGTLRIRASAEIAVAGGGRATAQQTGRIGAPRPPAFREGNYTGTTSQGLPIFLTASRTAIRSVYFRWRTRCADGRTHTNTIFVRGGRVRRGRFSFDGDLETGGSVHVSGRIKGVHASGTLSRTGMSAFGTKCAAKEIRWHARASGVEFGA